MTYLPHAPDDRQRMLEAIGAASVEDLLEDIPSSVRLGRPLDAPAPMDELALLRHLDELSQRNVAARGHVSLLGGGAYDHFIPSLVPQLSGRSEFLTAYTPYQAELSQGTLQAIFEFQTLVCQLTGMEAANASMYDGASALAEAVLMAQRITDRNQVLVSAGLHPEYREVLETYVQSIGLEITTVPLRADGRTDAQAGRELAGEPCCVIGQSPNFFGVVEDWGAVAGLARDTGALGIAVVVEALSLGLLQPPAAADIVVGEGQSFGLPLQFGGPYVGLFATKSTYLRQMPGRIVGRTVDAHGRPGYVLTLATREQHIRRQKATSNICTNHSLCALAAAVYLCAVGKRGLRALAELNAHKAAYACRRLTEIPGLQRTYSAPHFNEFVLTLNRPAAEVCAEAQADGITPGLALSRYDAARPNDLLVCVTEKVSRADIDRAVEVMSRLCA